LSHSTKWVFANALNGVRTEVGEAWFGASLFLLGIVLVSAKKALLFGVTNRSKVFEETVRI